MIISSLSMAAGSACSRIDINFNRTDDCLKLVDRCLNCCGVNRSDHFYTGKKDVVTCGNCKAFRRAEQEGVSSGISSSAVEKLGTRSCKLPAAVRSFWWSSEWEYPVAPKKQQVGSRFQSDGW